MRWLLAVFFGVFMMLPDSCLAHWLPESEFVIGGINTECTMKYVKEIYGEPPDKRWFNNDGFRGVCYIYNNVFIVTGRVPENDQTAEDDLPVKNIQSRVNIFATPSGLACGIPVTTLTGKYGKGEFQRLGSRISYYYTLPESKKTMTFYIGEGGIITEIVCAEEW